MLIGFGGLNQGPLANPDNMLRLAVEGEALGYDYMTVSDHVVIPTAIDNKYPYSDTGEFGPALRLAWYEQLTTVAYLAARTTKLRFLTSVMVVPHRPAVLTAKMIATIDQLSGGRITVGCGAGWMREEFEAIGAPPFADRGRATDEYLQAFKALWTESNPAFDGAYVKFKDIRFEPKPVQKPHPPLLIGGESGPAMRRAARLGDGWYPIAGNPGALLDTLPRYQAALARVRQLAAEHGRDPGKLILGYNSPQPGNAKQERTSDGHRKLFTGSPAQVAEDARAMRGLGVQYLGLRHAGPTVDATIDNLKRFKDEVVSRL